MAEDDFEQRRRKSKKFWTFEKVVVLVIFFVGFVIGIFVSNQFINQSINSNLSEQNAQLLEVNQELDSLNDKYYSCLQVFEIDPNTCVK